MREVTALSLPMMITALSTNLMVFLDRIILGHYSLEAMNSVAAATTATVPFIFGVWAIAAIAEVFVGQANGARNFRFVARPVWQMIWFSLFTILLFLPLGLWGGPLILAKPFLREGLPYYEWFMSTGFLMPLNVAVASFFVGRGRVKIVTLTAVFGNTVNLVLDVLLVFGLDGFLDPMGPQGAAIATVFSEALQVVILFYVFLNSKNRRKFNSHKFDIHWQTLKDCLNIGTPNALSHLVEMSAWYAIFVIMGTLSTEHVTVFQIGQTLFILFAFVADGLQKGVIALCSNAIGEKKPSKVSKIFLSSIKFHVLMVALLAIPFLVFPDFLIKLFLGAQNSMPIEPILEHGRIALAWVWAFLFFDDLVWIIAGILTSAGDTRFVMIISTISTWFFGVLPVYLMVFLLKNDPTMIWQLMTAFGFVNFVFFLLRYKSGKWKYLKISSEASA